MYSERLFAWQELMRNWKLVASGRDAGIPDPDLERVTPSLDSLEAVFRLLIRAIPHDIEPAVVFRPMEEGD